MRSRKFVIGSFAICLAAVACGQEPTVPVDVQDQAIYQKLVLTLDERKIWYEEAGETRLDVKKSDVQLVVNFLEETTTEMLPEGRSMSFPPDTNEEIKARLRSMGIEFSVVWAFGSEWVIWNAPGGA